MKSTRCIPEAKLNALLLGELSDSESAPLEQHLLECSSCVQRTARLSSVDTLVAAIRAGGRLEVSVQEIAALTTVARRLRKQTEIATSPTLNNQTPVASGRNAEPILRELQRLLAPPERIGEIGNVGEFRIQRLLGWGGMGIVLLAEDARLHRQVALKLLRPHLAQDTYSVQRFLREARSVAAIRHDHVVTIYQVGEAKGVPFIAQELLEGKTLEDHLRPGARLRPSNILKIGQEIAAGLSAAHKRGLLHRDIKPANIWIERKTARVKILDFGLARNQDGKDRLTQTGYLVGTPSYMAPEQSQGAAIDVRSDLFSLGVVLYRMATGQLPFPGNNTIAVLQSLANRIPPSAWTLNAKISKGLSDLIDQLLQKAPELRPRSAEIVQHRLEELLAQLDSEAKPISVSERSTFASRRLVFVAAATGVLILLLLAMVILKSNGTQRAMTFPGNPSTVQPGPEPNNPQDISDPTPDATRTDFTGIRYVRRLTELPLENINSVSVNADLTTVLVSGNPRGFENGGIGTFVVGFADGELKKVPNSRGVSLLLPPSKEAALLRVRDRKDLPSRYSMDFAVINLSTREVAWENQDEFDSLPTALDVSYDGRFVITAALDATVKLWDIVERRLVWMLDSPCYGSSFDVADTFQLLLTPGRGLRHFDDAREPLSIPVPLPFSGQPKALLHSGRMRLIAGGNVGFEGLHILSLPSFKSESILEIGQSKLFGMFLLPDGEHLFTSTLAGEVALWTLRTGKKVFSTVIEFEVPSSNGTNVPSVAMLAKDGRTILAYPISEVRRICNLDPWLDVWQLDPTQLPR